MRVFLAYAGARGYTLLNAELYLPKGWTDQPARLQGVGLARDLPFASKPQLAQRMLARDQAYLLWRCRPRHLLGQLTRVCGRGPGQSRANGIGL